MKLQANEVPTNLAQMVVGRVTDGSVAVKELRYVLTDRTYTTTVNSVSNRDQN